MHSENQSRPGNAPTPSTPTPRAYSLRRWISLGLVVAGGGLLGYVGGQYWYMIHIQHQLEASWQAENARRQDSKVSSTATVAAAASGQSLIRLVIPKISLEAIVVEGTNRQQLIAGPGHLADSAAPGETGNAVITAHRDTFFRHIFELEKGDEINVQRDGRLYRYEVTGKKVVEPSDLSVIHPTPDAQLTLITCYPIYYVGPAPKRLVVFSKLTTPANESLGSTEPPGKRSPTMY